MAVSPLVVGIDVGGTNTDSVLLRQAKNIEVIASHKAPTTANITFGIKNSLESLFEKSKILPSSVTALAIGTTHFLNAIIERDISRVEKVAVLRLASFNFSAGQPPYSAWPQALKDIIDGHTAIIPGGCNIDGSLIAPIDKLEIQNQIEIIKSKKLKNVVIVGIGSPMDKEYKQENTVAELVRVCLGPDVNIVLSHEVAGAGLLARENASILNASILNFARRTIRNLVSAMIESGLKCPLYLSSNQGQLLPCSEALRFPIRIFSSGATNSMRGAYLLAGSSIGENGCIVVDIGGTTTDVGYVLKNGYPRLATTYTDLAGVKINLEMPSVESIGLGGGSILKISNEIVVGPESVGCDLTTKALCFGGDVATATDVAVMLGSKIGTTNVTLNDKTVSSARAVMKRMLEVVIDRTKLSPEPCTVILVGGGSVLCPETLDGIKNIVIPEHADIANAIGAAMAKISGKAEFVVRTDDLASEVARAKVLAIKDAVARGGDGKDVIILNEETVGVPYSDGETRIFIEVACAADHGRVHREMVETVLVDAVDEEDIYEETKTHQAPLTEHKIQPAVDFSTYRPGIGPDNIWNVSQTDLEFLSIGCYILGCGGGGSPYGGYLGLTQLLLEGESIKIRDLDSLTSKDILAPVAAVGTPAVSIERPGGNLMLHALEEMSKLLSINYTTFLASEIGGSNGLTPLELGSSKFYNIPTVDGDTMGRAFPSFEMCSPYVTANSINDLLPVVLSSGTGLNITIPDTQTDEHSASLAIRTAVFSMGVAAGGVSRPISGPEIQKTGIPNTYSLAWRLGRAVSIAQQNSSVSTVTEKIIEQFGGPQSARRVFTGKIIRVDSALTTTAHSVGKVIIQKLAENERESDTDGAEDFSEVHIPFMNENLAVIGRLGESEKVISMVPDLIMLLDTGTGEAIGVQEYRYGLKVAVLIAAPHPIWTTKRGLEIVGPAVFKLPYEYSSDLVYTKPRSVIEEFRKTL